MSHNLGAGVTRKMNMHIMKAFRNGRKVFGTPVEQTPMGYNSLSDYLFDPQLLTEGEPPNDRGCRTCGKIGHFAKECPIVVARKKRNEREREWRKEEREQVDDDPGRNWSQCQDLDNRNNNRHDNRSDNRHNNRRQPDQDNREHNQHKGNYQGSSPQRISGRSYGGGHHTSPHADLTHSPYSGHFLLPYAAGEWWRQHASQVFYNSTINGTMRDGGGHMGSPYGGRPQMKIYFCGSIRGGRQDGLLYSKIVNQLKEYGKVLTEVVGDPTMPDTDVIPDGEDGWCHDQDIAFLRAADVVVAEVTQPSLGVGYELGRAVEMKKRTICMFRPESGRKLSAIVRGAVDGDLFTVLDYVEADVYNVVKSIMDGISLYRAIANHSHMSLS